MPHPTAYLVLASQRSGSTLLVESLRATGVAGEPGEFFQYLPETSQSPQPRQWFEGVEDESIIQLLDPLDAGKPDLAPPEIWRDYIRTVGRTPNGIWGGKLMWNQTPLLLQRAAGLPERSGAGLLSAIRDVIGSDPVLVHVYRPDVVSQAVSFWRAVQTRVWRGRPDPVRDSRASITQQRSRMSSRCCVNRRRAGAPGSTRKGSSRSISRTPFSGATSPRSSAPSSRSSDRIRGSHRRLCWNARPINAPTNGWTATGPTRKGRGSRHDDSDTSFDTVHVDELRLLEAEAVHIIREVVAELERPVLLFSAGKDSIVLLRLAEKAFRPSPLPFPVMHVDTGHNFPEVIEFRDRRVTGHGHKLIVASVQESIDSGRVPDPGHGESRNRQQTRTLLDALEAGGFDAAFGGARRDEERARAKERILSFRDEFGQWDPRAQRPEPWSLYNGRIKKGEQVRVFPLSNWTELDVWRYIELEHLELPSIYYAHEREVFERDGILLAVSEFARPVNGETAAIEWVRYRTVGDLTITGAVRSTATDIERVIAEISAATVSERGETRADDRTSAAAMEDRKREGYF